VATARYYIACLDLSGRDVLVVGGGRVALEKVAGLLDCGAEVTVVAPQIVPELAGLDVTLVRRGYLSGDLDGRFLVVAATSTASVNRRVFRDAEARAARNVVDVPGLARSSSHDPPGGRSRSRSRPAAPLARARQRAARRDRASRRPQHAAPPARCRSCGREANRTSPPTRSARRTSPARAGGAGDRPPVGAGPGDPI
jgi:precorrin-2 dehydrogenase/sirohydrochlorin ferrochelatase